MVHLAGVNRPPTPEEFALGNTGLTETLAKALLATGKPIPVIFSYSTQAAFFTAHPGVTRGGHYHHTKTEKFLVIKGQARFGFRHILTNETFTLFASGDLPTVVETIPGWSHDITNVGDIVVYVLSPLKNAKYLFFIWKPVIAVLINAYPKKLTVKLWTISVILI